MRMEMHWNTNLAAQCFYQFENRVWCAKPRHVFEREYVRTHLLEFLRHIHIIL